MSTGVKAAIAVAASLALVMGIGIMAAIAVPVFLQQRVKAKWTATTVTLPQAFDGAAAKPDQALKPLVKALADDHLSTSARSASYPTRTGKVYVVAGRTAHALTEPEVESSMKGFVDAARGAGVAASTVVAPPGASRMACLSLGKAGGTCMVTGRTAVMQVVTTGARDTEESTRQLWAASVVTP